LPWWNYRYGWNLDWVYGPDILPMIFHCDCCQSALFEHPDVE
jgi:hypothetical protein